MNEETMAPVTTLQFIKRATRFRTELVYGRESEGAQLSLYFPAPPFRLFLFSFPLNLLSSFSYVHLSELEAE